MSKEMQDDVERGMGKFAFLIGLRVAAVTLIEDKLSPSRKH